MKLHHLAIAVLVVGLFAVAMIDWMVGIGTSYESTADFTGLNKTQEAFAENFNKSRELEDEIYNITLELEDASTLEIPYRLVQLSFKSIKSFVISLGTIRTIATEAPEALAAADIPLPRWVVPAILSALVLIVMAILMYGFFKWKFSDD